MPQNRFQAYREANPHLFGVDSDFSDSESEHEETEENQETQNHENEETNEVTDNETIKSALHFEQISNFVSQRGRPSNYIPENEPTFRFISENAYNRPLDLLLETYGNKIFSEIVIGTNEKIEKLNQTDSVFYPCSESDIEQLFAILIIMNAYKSDNEEGRIKQPG